MRSVTRLMYLSSGTARPMSPVTASNFSPVSSSPLTSRSGSAAHRALPSHRYSCWPVLTIPVPAALSSCHRPRSVSYTSSRPLPVSVFRCRYR